MTSALEFHPVADLFPMLADDEMADLAADIRERGQLQPIVLDSEGRILDGRNRYAACQMAGVEPAFETYGGNDPSGYALAVNIARRNLTTGARAVITAKAARMNGIDHSAAARRTDLYRARIAEAGVVLEWAPDLADSIVAGVRPLSSALEIARDRKHEASELKAKMDRLHNEAADLRGLVDEERMSVDDAIAALDAREEKARQEEEARASEEAQREHDQSVTRAREIEVARSASQNIVTRVQADITAIVAGIQHGEPRLADKRMVKQIREAIDLLENLL
jgi:ParB-like chromosome segregation protein Spo0J